MLDITNPSHQILLAARFNGSSDYDVYDPNGGFCSFAVKDECIDWFVEGLIAQTAYGTSPSYVVNRYGRGEPPA